MRPAVFLAAASLLIATLAGLAPASGADEAGAAQSKRARELIASLEKPGAPGCALGVLREGGWVFRGAYGLADIPARKPNTPDLVFGVASITKQFTAAAAAIAVEQGYFSLDDDIRKFFPELPAYPVPITVRDLIQHTSGLRDHGRLVDLTGHPHRYGSLEQRLALLMRQRGTNFPAGTEFRYGNTGYLFLAALIERATGLSLARFATKNLFEPLGMRDTYFGSDARGNTARAIPYGRDGERWRSTEAEIAEPADLGSGGVMTTLDDYAKWARNLFAPRSALAGGTRLTSLLRSPGHLRDGTPTTYGFGLRLEPYRGIETVAHSGSGAGYKALAMMFPQRHLAVMGFCNNGIYAQPVVMALADIYLHLPPASEDASAGFPRSRPSPAELAAYEGAYREPVLRLPMRVRAEQGALLIEGDALTYRFEPLSATRFRNEENVQIEFSGVEGGRAQGFTQLQGRRYGSGRFQRVALSAPDAAQLRQYAGDYFSSDLDATYRFDVEGGALVARILDADADVSPFRLEPWIQDEFVDLPERLAIRFTRDESGTVTGLELTYQFGWITDVAFQRVVRPVAAPVASLRASIPVGAVGAAPPSPIDAVIDWSRKHAVDPATDLSSVRDLAGDARVLAFGEGTHNAHELWQWRNRLFRYAVEQLGFTAFAAETGYAQSVPADDYIQGRDVPVEKAVRGVFSWVNAAFEENRELLDWMRDWNARPTTLRKLHFYGLEMTGTLKPDGGLLIAPALDYVASVDPGRARASRERFIPLMAGFGIDRYEKWPAARQRELLDAVQELVTLFERYKVVWISRSSEERFHRAYHHAIAARQLMAHLRLDGDGRDIAAAENIRWVLEREGPRGRVFLFAHNSHVAKWRKLPEDVAQLHSTMAELAHDAVGDMPVIASFYDRGTTQDWLGMFGFTHQPRTLAPSLEGSVNGMLARLERSTALLDLRALPADGPIREWFASEKPVRNINVPKEYDGIRTALAFDALLFVRDVSPLRPMSAAP